MEAELGISPFRRRKLDGALLPESKYGTVNWLAQPPGHPKVTVMTAEKAYAHVAANAGASLRRDEADAFPISELQSFGTRGEDRRK